jgi:hypothetical protein
MLAQVIWSIFPFFKTWKELLSFHIAPCLDSLFRLIHCEGPIIGHQEKRMRVKAALAVMIVQLSAWVPVRLESAAILLEGHGFCPSTRSLSSRALTWVCPDALWHRSHIAPFYPCSPYFALCPPLRIMVMGPARRPAVLLPGSPLWKHQWATSSSRRCAAGDAEFESKGECKHEQLLEDAFRDIASARAWLGSQDAEEADLERAAETMVRLQQRIAQALSAMSPTVPTVATNTRTETYKQLESARSRATSIEEDLRQMIYSKPVILRIPPILRPSPRPSSGSSTSSAGAPTRAAEPSPQQQTMMHVKRNLTVARSGGGSGGAVFNNR